ncbi:hypothetical protein V1478_007469 [Vespula squamosa]|uniref:Uncharacterized protein n=1 Tax=Vespula squamosa TaxID=30214 RepID=A0ABD2B3F4_VESSQ
MHMEVRRMVMRSRNNGEDADDTMATRNETLPMRETEGTSREVSLVISGIRTLKRSKIKIISFIKARYHAPVNKHKVFSLKASNKNETFKMKFLRVKVEECTLVNEVHGSRNGNGRGRCKILQSLIKIVLCHITVTTTTTTTTTTKTTTIIIIHDNT